MQAYTDGLLDSAALHRVCIAAAADFRRVCARYGGRHAGRNLGKALKHLNTGACCRMQWGSSAQKVVCNTLQEDSRQQAMFAEPQDGAMWQPRQPAGLPHCTAFPPRSTPPPLYAPLADLRAANYVLPPRLQVPPLSIPGLAEGESLRGSRLPPPSPARSEALSDMSAFGQSVLH